MTLSWWSSGGSRRGTVSPSSPWSPPPPCVPGDAFPSLPRHHEDSIRADLRWTRVHPRLLGDEELLSQSAWLSTSGWLTTQSRCLCRLEPCIQSMSLFCQHVFVVCKCALLSLHCPRVCYSSPCVVERSCCEH